MEIYVQIYITNIAYKVYNEKIKYISVVEK